MGLKTRPLDTNNVQQFLIKRSFIIYWEKQLGVHTSLNVEYFKMSP